MNNKKVAILTQPLGHNYGGLLQAYALQTYLKKLGCEVETLDRRTLESTRVFAERHIKDFVKLLMGRIRSSVVAKRKAWVLEELANFRDNRLILSPKITSEKDLREYYRTHTFDIFLVGSDQVWRPLYSPSIMNFYLDFLDDIKNSAKRISYAASFGVNEWELSSEMTEQCRRLAHKFNAISVREKSAVDLCRDHLGIAAEWVVDPTLLLEPDEYNQLIAKGDENLDASGVVSYILDPSPEKRSITDSVGRSLGVNVLSIKPEHSITQVSEQNLAQCRFPSVETWLRAFQNARFIVTDSFHGTVFALLFNKPFIILGNSTRGMARFESFLDFFELSERIVNSRNKVTQEMIDSPINWSSVNIKREALVTTSRRFLKSQLKS